MRKVLLITCLSLLMITACGKAEPGVVNTGDVQELAALATPDWENMPEQLPKSMKGYELYSWQAGSERVYTLVTGTNRNKSFDEITAVENTIDGEYLKISVTSREDLEKLLSRLPTGEEVFWGGINLEGQVSEGAIYFSYPPDAEMKEILQFSEGINIRLHTLLDQQEGK